MSFWDKVRLTVGPDRNLNNLKQPVNNVSEMESPNDFRQTEMVDSAQNPINYNQRDIDRVQMYKDRNWAIDDTINKGAWDAYGKEPLAINPEDSLVNEINTRNNVMDTALGPNPYMQMTAQFEGNVPNVYTDDKGIPTYGVGHKLTNDELAEFGLRSDVSYAPGENWSDLKVDPQRINTQFETDYNLASEGAGRLMEQYGGNIQDMPEDLRALLTDMTLNMGVTGVGSNFPKFLNAMRDEDWNQAAAQLKYKNPIEQDGQWVAGSGGESDYFTQTGNRARTHYNTLLNY